MESRSRQRRDARMQAKMALEAAFKALVPPGTKISVGRTEKCGQGLSRRIFAAAVRLVPDRDRLSDAYVALVPEDEADPELEERTLREHRLLQRLQGLSLPFRVPRPVGVVTVSGQKILVRSFVMGIPLEGRPELKPWHWTGTIAAQVHALDLSSVAEVLSGSSSRRDHGVAELQSFEGLEDPEALDALAWAREHLPPEAPSTLIHGDLLGQNILLHPEKPPALIDWEYVGRGDPAQDLAIVTRGGRKPFKLSDGLKRLLETYHEAGGTALRVVDVRFYELCMAARWCQQARAGAEPREPYDHALGRLRGLLSRSAARSQE